MKNFGEVEAILLQDQADSMMRHLPDNSVGLTMLVSPDLKHTVFSAVGNELVLMTCVLGFIHGLYENLNMADRGLLKEYIDKFK